MREEREGEGNDSEDNRKKFPSSEIEIGVEVGVEN